ncbi:uncharacterized protein (DUF58 family) [Rhodopirellula rubra]|uniref:Uncharacterized protein (DUF58 family) n=1 Tax=Aporhodopirellula rubra TaxID=980271 RepID=A0A7W5H6T5_9BACT|nr:DUF58 domain-containing protein [Aporhodopirellula rubra]MBB3207295.1 uncharacterized protein (DUF58 family) [Aporhodopirellula rubra]
MNWEWSFVYRYSRFLWLYRFTTAGKWICAGLIFAAMIGSASVETPIYQLFCALTAFFFIDRFVGAATRPRLSVRYELPDRTTAGETFTTNLTVTNRGKRTAYDVGVAFFGLPDSVEMLDRETTHAQLPANESVATSLRMRARRRGIYPLPRPRAFSTFPFNLFRDARSESEKGSLLVLPSFHPLVEIDLPVGARYQPGGVALTSNIGESPEYIGNREYVSGDSARRIDYRSWARLGRPIVREYQEEYYCRVALVLDTFVPPGRKPTADGFVELEAAISMSASIADALSRGEYLIDLFAAGPELYVFRAGRHTAHFDNVLEIVAGVDACRKNPFGTVAPALADELVNISTVVGVFLDWDQSRRELVRVAMERGCRVKIIVVRDGETTEPIDLDEADVMQVGVTEVRDGGIETL